MSLNRLFKHINIDHEDIDLAVVTIQKLTENMRPVMCEGHVDHCSRADV